MKTIAVFFILMCSVFADDMVIQGEMYFTTGDGRIYTEETRPKNKVATQHYTRQGVEATAYMQRRSQANRTYTQEQRQMDLYRSVYNSSVRNSARTMQRTEQDNYQAITMRQGSMTEPVKSVTIDLYLENEVNQEQQQAQLAAIKLQLEQLQRQRTEVKTKYKMVVRGQ